LRLPIQFILQIILRIASMIRKIFAKFCFDDIGLSVQATEIIMHVDASFYLK
jgi:hypothetical protein